jgi:hypothetical protein
MTNIVTIDCPACVVCGEAARIAVPAEGLRLWHGGAFVQDAFPEMSADDRELLISGTHDKCWDILIGKDV